MAEQKNIKINRYNGLDYDQLMPETTIGQVVGLQTALDAKQPTLTAGQNISISGSTIGTKAFPCNPNLLDNWYFGNPVNQRGQTSYTGEIYGIDRWKGQWTGDGIVTIVDGGIKLYRQNYTAHLLEYIEFPQELAGQTVTLSVLGKNVWLAYVLNTAESSGKPGSSDIGIVTTTITLPATVTDFAVEVQSSAGETDNFIIAVKLELGSEQTLAHQDANGNWVLNEIPDYGEQLRRCQRYYYRVLGTGMPLCTGYSYTAGNTLAVVELPATMRSNPVVALTGNVLVRFAGGALFIAETVANYGFAGDKVQLYFTVEGGGITQGEPCDMYMGENSSIAFSADL